MTDVDERSLALARQVEALFAQEWKGGEVQRRAAVQVLIGDALREVESGDAPPVEVEIYAQDTSVWGETIIVERVPGLHAGCLVRANGAVRRIRTVVPISSDNVRLTLEPA